MKTHIVPDITVDIPMPTPKPDEGPRLEIMSMCLQAAVYLAKTGLKGPTELADDTTFIAKVMYRNLTGEEWTAPVRKETL